MAADSSSSSSPVEAPMSSTQHQVFINFRGKDVRNEFVKSLVDKMKVEGMNVFIDAFEVRGLPLEELFVRIEESKVVIVIFSENYGNSEWCLNELVKINECANNRTLIAIPVFYKLKVSDVKDAEGDFGFHFRALKRSYKNDTVSTQKWETAIASISAKHAMVLEAHGEDSDGEFIDRMIGEVRRSLEHIAKIANQRGQPKATQIQQPEQIQRPQSDAVQIQQPDVNHQGCVFNVRQLKISKSFNPRYWTFESISESPNGPVIEVAKMQGNNYYFEVSGKFDTKKLTSGTKYEVVFMVKVEDTMTKWDDPAKVQLMVPDKDLQERELQFVDLEKNEWVDIQAGVFEAWPHKEKIAFYLFQHNSSKRKTGLVLKGVIVRPVE